MLPAPPPARDHARQAERDGDAQRGADADEPERVRGHEADEIASGVAPIAIRTASSRDRRAIANASTP